MKRISLKKVWAGALSLAVVLSLCACGSSPASSSASQSTPADPNSPYAGQTLYVANW